jgi:[ribosomal protein S5]-alanine N-acetyltransferase
MELGNTQVKLRKWSSEDIDCLVQYANNTNIAENLTNQFPHPYTVSDGIVFINITTQHSPTQIFCIDVNGQAVGAIGIHPQQDIFCKNAELGYWLAEPFWGKGIMTAVVKQVVDYGFQNFAIDRIFARPFRTNISSQKVLEKAGFVLEAILAKTIYKNGIYQDECIYGIRK